MLRSHVLYLFIVGLFLLSGCAGPAALFTVTEAGKTAPAQVKVTNQSQKAERYEWDFGDGTQSTDSVPVHIYHASGNYAIKLKAIKGGKSNETVKNVVIHAPTECTIEIETKFGTMIAILYNSTPKHRDNFTKLADQGFYDDLLFHRVINGFMIQGGDPTSKKADEFTQIGGGGPGYTVPAEFVDSLVHIKGAIAAARTGDNVNPQKASSGSQFYIVQGKPVAEKMLEQMEGSKGFHYTKEQRKIYMEQGGVPFLDREYTVFGRVVSGLDVIDKIAAVRTKPGDRPEQDLKMKVRVIK